MATLFLLALAILLPPFQDVYGQQETFCTPQNRAANLNRCLAAIRFRALDKVNSPYGEAYFNRCPPRERFSPNCFEIDRITEPKSLAQLTFKVDNPDLSTIDRFMSLQYTSPAGSYTGCDHTYNYPNEKSFFVDPLSDIGYPSWDLREHPNGTWTHADGELFTRIIIDPNGMTKAVHANIRGDEFTDSLALHSYTGLWNSKNSPRPISFILYKQTRLLFLERIPSSGFNVTAFAEKNQLQGPVAFSWVNVLYDAYSVERNIHSDNCASLVEDAIQPVLPDVDNLPFNELDLKVFLRVRHTTRPVPYACGIYNITPIAKDFYLDPIHPSSFAVAADDLRSALTTFTMRMKKLNPRPSDFEGKLHTIMMISQQNKFVNGLIVNVEGDNITVQNGFHNPDATLNPMPFLVPNIVQSAGNHFFSFLAYEQTARIPTTLDLRTYLSCSGTREFTGMERFISDHQLTLVGMSSMMIKDDDEYSRCRRDNA